MIKNKAHHYYRYITASVLCLFACLLPAQNVFADPVMERNVKAAIIFNLARFSEWESYASSPDGPTDQFTICVIKTDMREALTSLSGKQIHGLTLAVKVLAKPSDISPICKVVYLTKSEVRNVDLLEIAKLGVLTISEREKFLQQNGGISIIHKGKKLGFSINRQTLATAHIQPNSKILRLSIGGRRPCNLIGSQTDALKLKSRFCLPLQPV